MPVARPGQHPLDPVGHQPPVYMRDGPMYIVHYPCPCGHELCVQSALVNSYHIRAIQDIQGGRMQYIQPAVAVPDDLINLNNFGPDYYVHQEPLTLQYPTYPEVQPRQYRRQSRRNTNRHNSHLDSDNESDIDR